MHSQKERKIGICNDNLKERNSIKRYVESINASYGKMVICDYFSKEIWEEVKQKSFSCDILIMDVVYLQLPFNGIELAKEINEICPSCKIIFLTEHMEFCSRVYEAEHCYFVLKHEMDAVLEQAIAKAVQLLDGTTALDMISFVSNGKRIYVLRDEVLYLERVNRKISVVTRENCYQTYQSLAEFENELKDSMVRIHAGFIVNMKNVVAVRGDYVEVRTGRLLPVSRTFENNIKTQYKKYS